jgi:peptidoglycan/xylan/chitin deacetylase (PgdA/CDA1 family)
MRPALIAIVLVVLLAGCGGNDPPPARPAPGKGAAARTPSRPRVDLKAKPSFIAARSSIPILCYHQLRPQTGADAAVDRPYIMPPARLRSQLDTLVRGGYHTISPDQLLAHLTTGARLPSRPVLLSFDDAVDDQYRVALPELRRRHMTATFFVMTVVLGNEGYMTRGQVRRLDRAGMTVAAHTWDHHRVDEYAGEDWRIQIDEPTQTLQRIVGHPIRFFAYPFGAWSPGAFSHLRHAGLQAAFQLVDQPITFRDPLMTIRRKIASPDWTPRQFEQALRGGFRKVGA